MGSGGNVVNTTPTKRKKKKPSFNIEDSGKLGREIYNNLVNGITVLRPVSGKLYIEVELELQDDNLFKDDELRKSKLIIEVNLEERKEGIE